MGTVVKPNTYVAGSTITASEVNSNEDTLYTLVNGNIDNANLDASASIAYTKLALTGTLTDDDVANTADIKLGTITLVIDGGGGVLQTGITGDIEVPFACAITAVTMLADQSTTTTIDIWKDVFANYPPDNADSITASAVPTITADTNSQDTTLSGWTTAVTAGDTLRFNVDANDNATRCTISLKYRKT